MLLLLHLVPYVRVVSYRYIFIYLLAFLASLPVPVVSVNSIMGLISFLSLILFFFTTSTLALSTNPPFA